MPEALYSLDILRLAASLGDWPALGVAEGSAERRSPTCGSRVRVDVERAQDGSVVAIGLSVSACALGQASAAILAADAIGRPLADFEAARDALAAYLKGESEALPDWPGIAQIAPVRDYPARQPSVLLAFEAAAAAIAAADTPDMEATRAHG